MKVYLILALLIAFVVSQGKKNGGGGGGEGGGGGKGKKNTTTVFLDTELDSHDESTFQIAGIWANWWPFWNIWLPDHVEFSNSIMTLTLDDQPCSYNPDACWGLPYASGEYRTWASYGPGHRF